ISRLIGIDSKSSKLYYILITGAILPVPFWFLSKIKYLKRINCLQYVHIPLMFSIGMNIPPAGPYVTWFIVCFLFNTVMKYWFWERYALLFSIAMDTGIQISTNFIFFALQNRQIKFPEWWGMRGNYSDGCPIANARYNGTFPHQSLT
ncbi:unnamed protein product, partial [Didymodactylos carnosus]